MALWLDDAHHQELASSWPPLDSDAAAPLASKPAASTTTAKKDKKKAKRAKLGN